MQATRITTEPMTIEERISDANNRLESHTRAKARFESRGLHGLAQAEQVYIESVNREIERLIDNV
jgi:hypothetical protein